MSARRLRVDPIGCAAHGICAELLPELIDLDEWGYPLLKATAVPRRLTADAERAVAGCPTLALRLERADGH
jgi:ferredoxin